jgi:hypothetical protein
MLMLQVVLNGLFRVECAELETSAIPRDCTSPLFASLFTCEADNIAEV